MASPSLPRTADGFGLDFGTSDLGHFVLTGLLLPVMLSSPRARLITVTSMAWLGWLTLAPLATAVYLYPPLLAGVAGAVCGLLLAASDRQMLRPAVNRGARLDEARYVAAAALLWAGVFALAAWLWPTACRRGGRWSCPPPRWRSL